MSCSAKPITLLPTGASAPPAASAPLEEPTPCEIDLAALENEAEKAALTRARPAPRPRPWQVAALVAAAVAASGTVIALAAGGARAEAEPLPQPTVALAGAFAPATAPPPPAFRLAPSIAADLVGPVPDFDDAPLTHPLPGPSRELPGSSSRRFGADRDGRGKAYGCGRGHCGVDLGEKIGTPILAVKDGIVSQVVRYDNERGGLMVAIDHEDGITSQYFHLKSIREDLRVGQVVVAGEPIAELGRSGIKQSPAHLHFALLRRGVEGKKRYLDPLPLLLDAVVVGN